MEGLGGGVSVVFGCSGSFSIGVGLERRFLATGVVFPSAVASVIVRSLVVSNESDCVSCSLLVFCKR